MHSRAVAVILCISLGVLVWRLADGGEIPVAGELRVVSLQLRPNADNLGSSWSISMLLPSQFSASSSEISGGGVKLRLLPLKSLEWQAFATVAIAQIHNPQLAEPIYRVQVFDPTAQKYRWIYTTGYQEGADCAELIAARGESGTVQACGWNGIAKFQLSVSCELDDVLSEIVSRCDQIVQNLKVSLNL